MKIYSYLEHRRQRKHDVRQLLISLQLRPREWSYTKYHGLDGRNGLNGIFALDNISQEMSVWVANKTWGLSFNIKGRHYGKITLLSHWFTWKRKVYQVAVSALKNKAILCNHVDV